MTPYLDVQHLSKSFGALQLFSDISFSIGEGQKVGLIAKNGTGKSTRRTDCEEWYGEIDIAQYSRRQGGIRQR